MTETHKRSRLKNALNLALLSALSLILIGCGGGGGSDDDDLAKEPAPQTMNGVIVRFTSGGGPVLTLTRSFGDALTGVETGNVKMGAGPGGIRVQDSAGNPTVLVVSTTISNASYTYIRTAAEGGRLVISGTGLDNVPGSSLAFDYYGGVFSRTYEMVFATDGNDVTAVLTTDFDTVDGRAAGAIRYTDGSLRLVGGGKVPVGWSIEKSSSLILPKLYPTRLTTQNMLLTLTLPSAEIQEFDFLVSTFTPLPGIGEGFIEKGVGNLFVGDNPTPETFNFQYKTDPTTINRATLRILRGSASPIDYEFTFTNNAKGTATVNGTLVGEFVFPFLR